MIPRKDLIPWFKSFFTRKLVKTGEGFTTDDEYLARRQTRNRKIIREGKNCVKCSTRTGTEFLFVGLSKNDDKVKYRLYHEPSRKTFDVDEALFQIVFKFKRP